MSRIRAAVVGGSGYIGGELVRLLLQHPAVELAQVTSETYRGKPLAAVHPNLRHLTRLKFVSMEELAPCDVLFLALPHGMAQTRLGALRSLSPRLIDLSSDFRLRDPQLYKTWYGHDHACPELLGAFVYGIPELHREAIASAALVSGAGCLATAAILGLYPLARAGLLSPEQPLVIEAKVGSSAAGNTPSLASHHPERHGVVRSFEPTGHRHTAEIVQELSAGTPLRVHFSATAVELVRGVLVTAHVFLPQPLSEKDVWGLYRQAYRDEPFIRLVKERQGVYRYPEPKILSGTNLCDVGFELDRHSNRLVVLSALDNLVKGGAGNGVQAMNCMLGLDETTGLTFPGLHPI
ncbi:MAG: N-acetyl-gamma-glutamyl-phosphate reductase [Candidatus Tectimicrobiota bacterium]|nr:MAG: N-acetyl-gamma-glutamyl-phosphate reductase [Candidatus Tectomicrobia bacterium]